MISIEDDSQPKPAQSAKAERIRADIATVVEQSPGASRGDLQAFVKGQSHAIRAVTKAMVTAGELVEHEGGLYPQGWTPPEPEPPEPEPPELKECRECYASLGCGDELCSQARWLASGRPKPFADWSDAGPPWPSRDEWAARGGQFDYDVITAKPAEDADCEMSNGLPGCGRADCYDCRNDWPGELCGHVTRVGRLCRNRAGRCRMHSGAENPAG